MTEDELRDPPPRCPHCNKHALWSTSERELRICNHCADRQYERYRERQEWDYFHRDDRAITTEESRNAE